MIQSALFAATSIAWFICAVSAIASVSMYREKYDPFAISAIGSVVSGAVALIAGVLGLAFTMALCFGRAA